jgi:hypothetical protein
MKKPVDDEDTRFFIQFIFDRLAANRNFDKKLTSWGGSRPAGTASRNMICFSKAYSNLSRRQAFYAGRKAMIAPNDCGVAAANAKTRGAASAALLP